MLNRGAVTFLVIGVEAITRQKLPITYVTLDHKTSLKSHGYICSNSQQYIVWVKIINLSKVWTGLKVTLLQSTKLHIFIMAA